MKLPDRILRKIDIGCDGECWIWNASIRPDGYGSVWLDGKTWQAHRAVYSILVGPIPDGAELDHFTCFNHACVNPQHLRVATHVANQENRKGANSNNKSGVRGVSWDSRKNRWRVCVGHNRKTFFGGHFAHLEEAAVAAKLLRAKLHATVV